MITYVIPFWYDGEPWVLVKFDGAKDAALPKATFDALVIEYGPDEDALVRAVVSHPQNRDPSIAERRQFGGEKP